MNGRPVRALRKFVAFISIHSACAMCILINRASYFALENGKRMGILIFEETDQARMPAINEPFFAAVDAAIEIQPVLMVENMERVSGVIP